MYSIPKTITLRWDFKNVCAWCDGLCLCSTCLWRPQDNRGYHLGNAVHFPLRYSLSLSMAWRLPIWLRHLTGSGRVPLSQWDCKYLEPCLTFCSMGSGDFWCGAHPHSSVKLVPPSGLLYTRHCSFDTNSPPFSSPSSLILSAAL